LCRKAVFTPLARFLIGNSEVENTTALAVVAYRVTEGDYFGHQDQIMAAWVTVLKPEGLYALMGKYRG
jgi:hypothetical protein